MRVQPNIIKHLIEEQPGIRGNNTKICLAYWEYVGKARGVEIPHDVKQIILDYKPESITRKRREVVESTDDQYVQAFNYNEKYSGRMGKRKDLD